VRSTVDLYLELGRKPVTLARLKLYGDGRVIEPVSQETTLRCSINRHLAGATYDAFPLLHDVLIRPGEEVDVQLFMQRGREAARMLAIASIFWIWVNDREIGTGEIIELYDEQGIAIPPQA
jgi:hypothetical protein